MLPECYQTGGIISYSQSTKLYVKSEFSFMYHIKSFPGISYHQDVKKLKTEITAQGNLHE